MPDPVDLATKRRSEILGAALKIVSEKGYQNTGIADIATELGIGHGTFYRYFKNKQDVVSAVLDEVMRRVTKVALDIPAESIDTLEQYRERLVLIGNALFDIMETDPYVEKWLAFETLGLPMEAADRIHAAFELFAVYTETYLKNGIEKGFLRKDIHTRATAQGLNAMLFEAAKQISRSPEPRDDVRKMWSETIIGVMLDGLAARQTGSSRK